MSEEEPFNKNVTGSSNLSEFDRMKRALIVHKNWIWSDGLRILKLANRINTLEQEMAAMSDRLGQITMPSEN